MSAVDPVLVAKEPNAEKGILKLAVMAVGGQGGGVLSSWIADLATLGGYDVQATSVAGVAQRTGATIYYIEMVPKGETPAVFALSPAPGDVDVLIASELMEAGRAVIRGFVTPDRTTLIASTHRILAVSEKQVPGDGRGSSGEVATSIEKSARVTVCFDMEKLAKDANSMISASLFGALARSNALPFPTPFFEQVIATSGRGVAQSLAAFHAALSYEAPNPERSVGASTQTVLGPANLRNEWATLAARVLALPMPAQAMATAGLRKVVDYQDTEYGSEFLDHIERVAGLDLEAELTIQAAKYVANAMCYDDILRVADLKTRGTRNTRLRREQEVGSDDIIHVTEYFHPRVEELISILPAKMGRGVEQGWIVRAVLGKITQNGKRIRTDRVCGFAVLWLVAGLRTIRRRLLRHETEQAHVQRLLTVALSKADHSSDVACEILKCQRLIKGYADTHARGHSKFDRVFGMLDLLDGRDDAAAWVARLREAALADEKGLALDGAIRTIHSFTTKD